MNSTTSDPSVLYRYEAAYCWFNISWAGTDLMFMTGTGVRLCKISGKRTVRHFGMEVNPRGATEADCWERSCWDYIPEGMILTFEELASMPNTSWAHLTVSQLKEEFEKAALILTEKRNIFKNRPILYDHWAFGSPAALKKKKPPTMAEPLRGKKGLSRHFRS